MSDTTTITPEEMALWASVATARINAVTPERQCEITAQERLVKALKALEQAEAEVVRLKLKCGEAAPEGTEVFHVFGSEMVICPSCGEEIEEPWDEPGTDSDEDGNWHGVIECRGCDSKVEVHSQLIHFWTAKLADAEAARRAVADAESEVKG